jgi:O-antigen/teichoic acid export membrane protein
VKNSDSYRQVLWNHFGKGADLALTYATSLVLARSFELHTYGIFANAGTVAQLLLVVGGWGIEAALVRFLSVPDLRSGQSTFLVRRAVVLRTASLVVPGMLIIVLPGLLSPWMPAGGQDVALVLVLYSIVRSLVPLLTAVLVTGRRLAWWSATTVGVRLLELALSLTLLSRYPGVLNALLLFTVTGGLHCLLLSFRAGITGSEERVDTTAIRRFSGIMWLKTGMDFVMGRYGDLLLLGLLGAGPVAAALYDVSYSLAQIASMAMTLGLTGVLMSRMSFHSSQNTSDAESLFLSGVRIQTLLQIPVYAVLVVHAGSVVSLLYGVKYAAATGLLRTIAALRLVGRAFGGGENSEFLLVNDKPGSVVWTTAAAAGVNLILDILLIPRLGVLGAVIGGGIGGFAGTLLTFLVIRKTMSIQYSMLAWFHLAAVCGVIAGATGFLPATLPLLDLAIPLLVCFLAAWLVFRYSSAFTEADRGHVARMFAAIRFSDGKRITQ